MIATSDIIDIIRKHLPTCTVNICGTQGDEPKGLHIEIRQTTTDDRFVHYHILTETDMLCMRDETLIYTVNGMAERAKAAFDTAIKETANGNKS